MFVHPFLIALDFPAEPPARATYAVSGLPKGKELLALGVSETTIADALVEIEAVALADGPLDPDAKI